MTRTDRIVTSRASRRRMIVWGGALALLVAPAIAMLFTREVNWSPGDFVMFAALLLLGCVAYEMLDRAGTGRTYRSAAALAVGTAILLVWADLSVGYAGDSPSPMFAGVVLVAVVGAGLARLRPTGMALAMVATATAQLLAGLVSLTIDSRSALQTVVFMLLWLGSACLFRKAKGSAP